MVAWDLRVFLKQNYSPRKYFRILQEIGAGSI